jgi:L-ribulose-5-phosphate 4-epimerase
MTFARDTLRLRREVINTCRFLQDIGYFIGTWGNVAVRVEEGILVTPTRLSYDALVPGDLVVVSGGGERIKGTRLPSSETGLHRLILARRPEFGVSLHTHSPFASCAAAMRQTIPVLTEEMSQILGGQVRCSRYVPAGRHIAFAAAVVDALGPEVNAVLAANHGAVVVGRDLDEAVAAAQVLEKAALIYVHAKAAGKYHVIPPRLVIRERKRYLYRYGQE